MFGPRFFRDPAEVAGELADACLDARFRNVTAAYVDRGVVGLPSRSGLDLADQSRMWSVSSALLGLAENEPPPRIEAPPRRPNPRAPTLLRWATHLAIGEVVGFTATAMVGFVVLAIGGHPETVLGRLVALVVMTATGVVEGGCLGFAQWRAMQDLLPTLSAREWVKATVAVASLGWAIGMSMPLLATVLAARPSDETAGASFDPPMAMVIAVSSLFGALVGAVFGGAQGLVLRRHLEADGAHRGVRRWVLANAIGWAVGLPAT
jgi:hypothetical protein